MLLHQERVIIEVLFLDGIQAQENVIVTELNVMIEQSEKLFDIAVDLERELWQIDGDEGEIASRTGLLGTVEICHDARSTAHGRDARIIIAGLIILEIIRRVDVDEIREEATGADLACLEKQIVIRIVGIIIDAGF